MNKEYVSTTRDWFINLINKERDRQVTEWGFEHDANHSPEDWALLLSKHVGRLADEALESARGYKFSEEYIHRLTIIAALCTAAAEGAL